LRAAELKEIWRQKADSHKAIVAELRAGDLEPAFKQLEKLGMLRELEPEQRHETLAADYVSAVKKGKSALVISPTHAEGERVTARIREWLKQAGKLCQRHRLFGRIDYRFDLGFKTHSLKENHHARNRKALYRYYSS